MDDTPSESVYRSWAPRKKIKIKNFLKSRKKKITGKKVSFAKDLFNVIPIRYSESDADDDEDSSLSQSLFKVDPINPADFGLKPLNEITSSDDSGYCYDRSIATEPSIPHPRYEIGSTPSSSSIDSDAGSSSITNSPEETLNLIFIELPISLQILWDDDSELYDVIKFLGKWGKYNVVLEGTLDVGKSWEEQDQYHFQLPIQQPRTQQELIGSSYRSNTRSGTRTSYIQNNQWQDGLYQHKTRLSNTDRRPYIPLIKPPPALDLSFENDVRPDDCDCAVVDHLFTEYVRTNASHHSKQKTLFCRFCDSPHIIELM